MTSRERAAAPQFENPPANLAAVSNDRDSCSVLFAPPVSNERLILAAFLLLGFLSAASKALVFLGATYLSPRLLLQWLVDSAFSVVGFGVLGALLLAFLRLLLRLVDALTAVPVMTRADSASVPASLIPERMGQPGISFPDENSNSQESGNRGAFADIRKAIRAESWDEAAGLLADLRASDPDDSSVTQLSEEFESSRKATGDRHLKSIETAKAVNDPDRVLELFEQASTLLEFEERTVLELDLARWFMSLVQRKLRSGVIQAEVVTLATRVSDLFGGTVEGASLRASLPTLRRSVGLCAKCGQPYTGVENACPECLSGK